MQASKVTNFIFDHLSYRSERQKVISANIANINTPDYKTKELVFQDELKKANDDLKLKMTNVNHIPFDLDEPKMVGPQMVEVKNLLENNDGNNVSMDKQVTEMAKNTTLFNALQVAVKKDASWFKEVITASGKN